jgi:hypothetical protein
MNVEADLAAWWAGVKGWVGAHRWWLAAMAGAFVLGAVL